MRLTAAATSLSWIPSEAVTGLPREAFERGVTHYDVPPPEDVGGLEQLRTMAREDRFRFANRLAAEVEVRDGRVVAADYAGSSAGVMGGSTVRVGPFSTRMAAVELPLLREPVDVSDERAVLVQTYGGRAALPAPRRVTRPPYVQVRAPLVWTTVELTVRADGTVSSTFRGASAFPRHWLYDDGGALAAKVGLADFEGWYRTSFGENSPWGAQDSPALVTEVETALERVVAGVVMHGAAKPTVRSLPAGAVLTREGEPGDELFLLLDGVVAVEVAGRELGPLGPGAVLGERALLEGGRRSATVTALTPVRLAVAAGSAVDREALRRISESHRREERGEGPPRSG